MSSRNPAIDGQERCAVAGPLLHPLSVGSRHPGCSAIDRDNARSVGGCRTSSRLLVVGMNSLVGVSVDELAEPVDVAKWVRTHGCGLQIGNPSGTEGLDSVADKRLVADQIRVHEKIVRDCCRCIEVTAVEVGVLDPECFGLIAVAHEDV